MQTIYYKRRREFKEQRNSKVSRDSEDQGSVGGDREGEGEGEGPRRQNGTVKEIITDDGRGIEEEHLRLSIFVEESWNEHLGTPHTRFVKPSFRVSFFSLPYPAYARKFNRVKFYGDIHLEPQPHDQGQRNIEVKDEYGKSTSTADLRKLLEPLEIREASMDIGEKHKSRKDSSTKDPRKGSKTAYPQNSPLPERCKMALYVRPTNI